MKNEIKRSITFKIPVSISHSICTKIQKASDIWRTESRHRENNQETVEETVKLVDKVQFI